MFFNHYQRFSGARIDKNGNRSDFHAIKSTDEGYSGKHVKNTADCCNGGGGHLKKKIDSSDGSYLGNGAKSFVEGSRGGKGRGIDFK